MQKILIVEDDLVQRELLSSFLKSEFKLEFAESISKAKELLKSPFDFIFLDFELGDGTALDVLAFLEQKSIKTPTVILSAFASIPKVVESLKIGASDFLEKPLYKENILKVIYQYIGKDAFNSLDLNNDLVYQKNSPFAETVKLATLVSNKFCPVFNPKSVLKNVSGCSSNNCLKFLDTTLRLE